tara:strand:+ start:5208 stop:5945 length:738 start_codon:yes stop_codon:yes gene_type:complete
MNKMVSIKRAVLNTMEDLGTEQADALLIKRWCAEAEKQIGGRYQYIIQRHVLDLKGDGTYADLPCETFEVVSAFLGNVGEDCTLSWGGYGNSSFDPAWSRSDWEQGVGITIITGSHYSDNSVANYEIVNNKLSFSCQVEGHSQVTVYLMRYQVDDDGWVMVAEEHLDAIPYYVMKKMAERSAFNPKAMPMNSMQYFLREWGRKKSIARGKTAKLTPKERESLVDMVNNPISGKVINYGILSQSVQ